MELRDTFDAVAEVYDAIRPAYPEALFEDIGGLAVLRPGDPVLEVGCGSGQATTNLLDRGYRVTAIDPGAALIAAAERRFGARRNLTLLKARFEDWDPPEAGFRLVAAAQAWHWIPPAQAYARAARALAPGGWLAIFGHVPVRRPPDFQRAAQPIYIRHAPELWAPPPESWYLPQGPLAGLIGGSGAFGRPTHRAYPWTWRHTPASYRDFLRSRSDVQLIPEPNREALITELGRLVADRGGALEIGYESHLYMAPVK